MSSSTTVRTARRRTLYVAGAALTAAAGLALTAGLGSDAAAKPAGTVAAASTTSGWSGVQSVDERVSASGWSGLQSVDGKASASGWSGLQ